ncbi:GTP 3',8-cyclase MoaA [Thermofilum pendens]|uniref:GTP 3',8-cyclase MoaA n=1 Tax=Thermofilum pendens TaxID=2269 RepID=UPI00069B6700|nr:GTP 3',8-cyclase MoaA [Thermofilum pendens]
MLVDRFGRPLENLRITVTPQCNFNCVFCHGEGEPPNNALLSASEIVEVASVAHSLGVGTFKLTGGEPLLRKDLERIVAGLKSFGRGVEVSLTTNGFFLEKRVPSLVEAGLDRVNVSLHAFDPEVFEGVTRVKGFEKVLRGLEAASEYGLPVKLNFVLTKLNAGQLGEVLDYASRKGFNVNLIELIPTGKGGAVFDELYVPVENVLPQLEGMARKVYTRPLQSRPVFELETGIKVEVIANYCNPAFCSMCTKLRLTHDGKLKPCLNRNDNLVDLTPILRDEGGDKLERLREAFLIANSRREPFFRFNGEKVTSFNGRIVCPVRRVTLLSNARGPRREALPR